MNPKRMLAITKKVFYGFVHDKRTLLFVLIQPVLMMVLFGYTFGGDPENLPVDVVNADRGVDTGWSTTHIVRVSDNIIKQLKTGATLDVKEWYVPPNATAEQEKAVLDQAIQRVRDGKSWCVFYFPGNFSENARNSTQSDPEANVTNITLQLFMDASNVNIVAPIVKKVNDAILGSIKDLSSEFGKKNTGTVDIEKTFIYGSEKTKFIDNFAPGMMGFSLVIITIGLSILTFVSERTNMTLDRLIASPVTEAEIVIGNSLGFSAIAILQSIITLGVAVFWFGIGVPVRRIPLTLLILILLSLSHLGIGILLSVYSQNEFQAVQLMPIVTFPSILLSGLFWPIESIPAILRPLAYLVPLKWGIDALRNVMLRDWNVLDIWPAMVALIGFAVLSIGGSILLLKYKR